MRVRALPLAAALLLAACGRPDAAPTAPVAPAPAASSPGAAASPAGTAPPAAPSAEAAPPAAPSAEAAAPAAPSAEAAASAVAAASDAGGALPSEPDPTVFKLSRLFIGKVLTVTAGGRAERVVTRSFRGDTPEHGRVPPASVEAFHRVLREARFCSLAPKQRESAPSYTVMEASFPDVACWVELPDSRWERLPAARRVLDAARRLEAEAFPKP
ncbi:hypothetical protein [Sorangium sp. So ce542]|uniref:hypothetical protein n=1 Tax=Sorangium sp. So ce542 TaxID=3133316 RepID=UPI003F6048A2